MIRISVQHEADRSCGRIVGVEGAGSGAVATFSGFVRADDGVTQLELEHYPGMTEAALKSLAEAATARWSLIGRDASFTAWGRWHPATDRAGGDCRRRTAPRRWRHAPI